MCKKQWKEVSREEADQCKVPEQTRGGGAQAQLLSDWAGTSSIRIGRKGKGKAGGRQEAEGVFTWLLQCAFWQPTPVFLPGKSHGQRAPVGYSPQGHRVEHDWVTNTTTTSACLLLCKSEGKTEGSTPWGGWRRCESIISREKERHLACGTRLDALRVWLRLEDIFNWIFIWTLC